MSEVTVEIPLDQLGMRIAITGSPRSGKTEMSVALARDFNVIARHTDELVGKVAWGEDSLEVCKWFEAEGPLLIEGVTVVRALRKWLAAHPIGKPCDLVVYCPVPVVELTKGQETMRKGVATVWNEIRDALEARGVQIR